MKVVGQAQAQHLSELAWGRDTRFVTTEHVERTIGNERTFDVDVDDIDELTDQLMYLSDLVARRLRHADVATKTISLKVRFADFTTVTRNKTLGNPTDTAQEIFNVARVLLENVHMQRTRIRLLGIRGEHLVPSKDVQAQLNFAKREAGWREAERVLDRVAEKFGIKMLRQARLVHPEDTIAQDDDSNGRQSQ
jgi:DNA polymerase-4